MSLVAYLEGWDGDVDKESNSSTPMSLPFMIERIIALLARLGEDSIEESSVKDSPVQRIYTQRWKWTW